PGEVVLVVDLVEVERFELRLVRAEIEVLGIFGHQIKSLAEVPVDVILVEFGDPRAESLVDFGEGSLSQRQQRRKHRRKTNSHRSQNGWDAGIRTPIRRSRVCSLTVRRRPNALVPILSPGAAGLLVMIEDSWPASIALC